MNDMNSNATTTPAKTVAHLTVQRGTATSTTSIGSTVRETLSVYNDSDQDTIPVVIHDVLRGPTGTVVHEEMWDIGSVGHGEQLMLGYDAGFTKDVPAGTYSLSTVIYSKEGKLLGSFDANGSILVGTQVTKTDHSILSTVLPARIIGTSNSDSGGPDMFQNVPVAHASANDTSLAAAAGFTSGSWMLFTTLGFVLFALMFVVGRRFRGGFYV